MPRKRALTFNSETFLKKIGSRQTSREYRNKQPIFSQGDVADAMFYVEAGNVKLTVLSKRGKKAVIAIFRQGDFFGEGCLGAPSLRMSTATAVHLATITRVEKATIVRIIHDDPVFARLLIAHLLSRVVRIEEDFLDQLFNSSEKRLARTLLLLASFGDAIQAISRQPEGESGDPGRDDWHHPVESKLLHEPVSQDGPHRLQRQLAGAQGTAHLPSATNKRRIIVILEVTFRPTKVAK